jgi:hypothetical protein
VERYSDYTINQLVEELRDARAIYNAGVDEYGPYFAQGKAGKLILGKARDLEKTLKAFERNVGHSTAGGGNYKAELKPITVSKLLRFGVRILFAVATAHIVYRACQFISDL